MLACHIRVAGACPGRWAWAGVLAVMMLAGLAIALAPFTPGQPDWFAHADKFRHAAAFAAFWWVGVRAVPRRRVWLAILAAGLLAYGGLVELMQGWLTPDREASWLDWLADATGLLLGAALLRGWERRQPASHMNTAGSLSGS